MNSHPHSIRTTTLGMICSSLLLAGCSSNQMTPQAILNQGGDNQQVGAISISELLSNARLQNGSANKDDQPEQITLTFSANQMKLSEQQAQQLNAYANQYSVKPVYLKCAPSDVSDSFTAMAQGMKRCIHVSQFLTRRALKAEVHMQPQLVHNQILVTQ
ncbi:hypothetical protein [Aliamphritea ceti]|uniref:hypothetical protein n=1 Tax=Aliamphritea ceti TaxID=1524258 RepID=UPI0021C302E2|nr:hypothetical protein [Aliamphritea ceti]